MIKKKNGSPPIYIYLIVDKHIYIAKASTVPIATAKRKRLKRQRVVAFFHPFH
jgi:hypothetical protein